jgi:hypothetical protein
MAQWPAVAELKQVLDVVGDDWDNTLDGVLAAAIIKVKKDVGHWNDTVDEPDDSLNRAALRMAELMALKPEVATAVRVRDMAYQAYLFGHRRSFGVS